MRDDFSRAEAAHLLGRVVTAHARLTATGDMSEHSGYVVPGETGRVAAVTERATGRYEVTVRWDRAKVGAEGVPVPKLGLLTPALFGAGAITVGELWDGEL